MDKDTLDTERLSLRRFTLEDVDFIIALLNTDGWIKYIGDRNVHTTTDARRYLEEGPLKSYQQNFFGLRLVTLKTGDSPIGMCGLVKRDYLDYPDLGFAFLPNYTGRGYGFEISKRLLDYAFRELRYEKIFGVTLPSNYSSIRLLMKIGFEYSNNFVTEDSNEELSLYSIASEKYVYPKTVVLDN